MEFLLVLKVMMNAITLGLIVYLYFNSWKAGEWSMCSAKCGTGTQTRAVGCEERYDDAESVDTELCDEKLRPEHIRECDTETPCHQWSTGPWSKVIHPMTVCFDEKLKLLRSRLMWLDRVEFL